MSIKELLQPRYKVISDYPDSCYSIGDILCKSKTHDGWFDAKKGHSRHITVLGKHTHIFKKLEWWEERKVEDMPEYVRNNVKGAFSFGEVYKIHKVLPISHEFTFKDKFSQFTHLEFKHTLPATLEEYANCQNKKS